MSTSGAVVGEIEYRVKISTKDFKTEISRVEKTMKTELGAAGDKSGEEAGKKASRGFGTKFKDGLKNIGSGFLGGIGASMFNGIVNGAKSAFSGAGNIVKSSISSFGDYEQLIGGVETLFKGSAGIVEGYANNAYKTAGLSANQYMDTVTSFSASLLQSLDGDTEAAAKAGDMAITDMADNANKMGTSMESIQNAYQGFAKQNYMMLDNLRLGYGGTKEEMQRLLADAEKISGVHYDISNLSDVYNAIHVIQGKLDITGTTAKEASSTLQGSAASMKAAWENLLTGMANPDADIGGLIDQLLDSLGTFLDNLLPIAGRALDGIVKLVSSLAPKLAEMLPELLPGIIEAIVGIISALIEVLPDILQAILPPVLAGLEKIILALIEALPALLESLIKIIITVVDILTRPDSLNMILSAAITFFMAILKSLPQIITSLANALPTIIDSIITFLTDPKTIEMLIEAAVTLFFALITAVPKILGSLIGAFGKLVGALWEGIIKLFGDFAGKFGDFIGGIFKGAINGVIGFIEGFINTPIGILNGFIELINGAFGVVGVNLSKIDTVKLPRLASGGIVPARAGGQIIMAGEAGDDEWVVPESKMSSLIDKINKNDNYGGGATFNFTFNGIVGTKSELRQCAITFHEAYEEVKRARMVA